MECKLDFSKGKGYAVNFEYDNFKNKLHQMVNINGPDDLGCLSGYLFMDTDNAWKHLNTELASTLANHKNSRSLMNSMSKVPMLIKPKFI